MLGRHLSRSSPLVQAASVAAVPALLRALPLGSRLYHENIIDHYESPRNVGSMDKKDPRVGTGLVGAPACGDVMKLQMKVGPDGRVEHAVFKVRPRPAWPCAQMKGVLCLQLAMLAPLPLMRPNTYPSALTFAFARSHARSQTFGCGSAIASSSYATEWLKGKTLDECGKIENSDIAKHLKLPPVKLHCSMLAEDAVKMAIKDYQAKQEKLGASGDATEPPAAAASSQ